jgi:hypothetical protein
MLVSIPEPEQAGTAAKPEPMVIGLPLRGLQGGATSATG